MNFRKIYQFTIYTVKYERVRLCFIHVYTLSGKLSENMCVLYVH